jgi:hypothetical protein
MDLPKNRRGGTGRLGRPPAVDPLELLRLYYGDPDRPEAPGLSMTAVGRLTGIDRTTVRYHVSKDPRYTEEVRRRGVEGLEHPESRTGRSRGHYGFVGGTDRRGAVV